MVPLAVYLMGQPGLDDAKPSLAGLLQRLSGGWGWPGVPGGGAMCQLLQLKGLALAPAKQSALPNG